MLSCSQQMVNVQDCLQALSHDLCEPPRGSAVVEVSKKLTEQTYYRWRRKYGGARIEQAKRLKEFEKENARLKKIVADLSLDNEILREVSWGNF